MQEQNRGPGAGPEYDVAIIGGGFSGICSAYHVLTAAAEADVRLRCILIEQSKAIGGIAYGTDSARHLLNVRAEHMSLSETKHDSFLLWLKKNSPELGAGMFLPRKIFRQYMEDLLMETARTMSPGTPLTVKEGEVTDVGQSAAMYQLQTADGESFSAARVILALGNLASESALFSPEEKSKKLLLNPWASYAEADLSRQKKIAIIGTGLSALDVILEAEASGFRGTYVLISRHGLLPRPHCEPPAQPSALAKEWAGILAGEKNALSSLRVFRKAVRAGVVWHELIDALRPSLQSLWRGFDTTEKRKFLRQIRPYWDVHRHRAPQESLAVVSALSDEGRLNVKCARVVKGALNGESVELTLSENSSETHNRASFDRVFDCRGLFTDIRRASSPLLKNLAAGGMVSYDDLSMGIKADPKGLILNQKGSAQPNFYTLGSLRRGELWETTAAREIRTQAYAIAQEMIKELA